LSSHLKGRVEKIEQVLSKLIEESAKGKPIVVEGKKDESALIELGAIGTILTVKTAGKSFLEATSEIEAVRSGEVILLLDFDRRGREGTKRLQQDLEMAKIKANVKFWRELDGLVGREIQCVESLPSYLITLQKKVSKSISET
jgi:5S rRNA maturation endonuclease (ribonuclease M5)